MSAPVEPEIPGYTYGAATVADSPVTLDELRRLEATAGLTDEDRRYLDLAGDVLEDQADRLVDAWRAVIAAQPHLARVFTAPDARPDEAYKAAARRRFVRWVLDTCRRPRDRAWLDYQEEIGLRHTPAKKNRTDGARTPPLVPLRDVIAFSAVVITTIRPFLEAKGHGAREVEAMERAWTKAVLLQIALWSRPYTLEGLW